jgi:predicted phage-related endonuclease
MTPTVSNDTYEDIRAKTLMPHETPSLFESVAEISTTDTETDEEFTDQDGEAVNAFASPLSLWEMKTGRYKSAPPTTRSLWSRMKWGVMDACAENDGLETRRPAGTYIHPTVSMLSAKPDMEVSDDGQNWYPMIAKNVASTMADMWKNAVGQHTPPENMFVEGHQHMAVTGADRFYIAALFGGVTTKLFVIHRDDDLIADIEEAAQAFWECVENDRMPKPSGVKDATVIGRINAIIDPKDAVVDMTGDTDFQSAWEEKETLAKDKTKIEKRLKELTAHLNERLNGCSSAILSETRQVKWVKQEEKVVSFVRKASAHLRASKISEKAAGTPIQELVD